MTNASQPNPILEIHHLSKQFAIGSAFRPSYVHALSNVSFAIGRGEVVALVGESGSGKSTIARLLARLMPPTEGEIIFEGKDVLKSQPNAASLAYRSAVQMIFQDPFGSLNPVHTIGYHLERPVRIHARARGKAVSEQVHALLTTVGLNPAAEFAQKYPHQLSGGQRQRVAIARALAVDPQIILADEPISMLDVSIRMGILNLLEQLKEERGLGYLYITHDLASARYIGDRTIVMYAGYMVESAASEELMENPAHPYTQLLLSAVPDARAGFSAQALPARGEPPKLITLKGQKPVGCPFAARCPQVMEVCRQQMPEQTTVAAGHWVRCHAANQFSIDKSGTAVKS